MILHVIAPIQKIIDKHFKEMLREGAFPEIHWEEYPGGHSYHLFEFSDTRARFSKYIDRKIKEIAKEELGIFTRKHNAAFLAIVQNIADETTEGDVIAQPDRFTSFADAVRGEAMRHI
jgi:hypothetical protein